MKKIIWLALGLALISTSLLGQADSTKYWKKGGLINVSFNQVALVNWAAGGEENISSSLLVKLFANYAKDKWIWNNDITIGYGGILKGSQPWEKTDDRIEVNSKLGRELANNWYNSAFLNFRTQMIDGYKLPDDSTLISTWMAPGYLTGGVGFDYVPNENLSLNISPLAAKVTFVGNQNLADFGAYGVDPAERDTAGNIITPGKTHRFELGGNVSFQFKKEILKNVNFDTKLNLFSNYLDRPENIDVNWDLMLNMKVNEWLSTNIFCSLIYDHDIDLPVDTDNNGVNDAVGPRTQFKEVLGVGLNLAF